MFSPIEGGKIDTMSGINKDAAEVEKASSDSPGLTRSAIPTEKKLLELNRVFKVP